MTQQSRLRLPSHVNPQQPELPLKGLGLPTRPALLGRFLPTWRSAFCQRMRRLQLSLTLKSPLGAAEHTGSPHSLEWDNGNGVPALGDHRTTTEPEPRTWGQGQEQQGGHLTFPMAAARIPSQSTSLSVLTLIPALHWAELENIPTNIKVAKTHDSCTFC